MWRRRDRRAVRAHRAPGHGVAACRRRGGRVLSLPRHGTCRAISSLPRSSAWWLSASFASTAFTERGGGRSGAGAGFLQRSARPRPDADQIAGTGCRRCSFTGFYERTGVFECMGVDEQVRAMIVEPGRRRSRSGNTHAARACARCRTRCVIWSTRQDHDRRGDAHRVRVVRERNGTGRLCGNDAKRRTYGQSVRSFLTYSLGNGQTPGHHPVLPSTGLVRPSGRPGHDRHRDVRREGHNPRLREAYRLSPTSKRVRA